MSRNRKKTVAGIARLGVRKGERGAALAIAMILLVLIGVVSATVLAVVSNEARISGSDLQRTQTYFATSAGIERMTMRFSDLFARTTRPSQGQLNDIAADPPQELTAKGFVFNQTLAPDTETLDKIKLANGGKSPITTIPQGSPFTGLIASLSPYRLTSTVSHAKMNTQVTLERNVNNYLIPLFQFGTFSDKDLEFWPEPPMTFNGRVHANGNIYFGGDILFQAKVTTAQEAVRNRLRNNAANTNKVGGTGGYDSKPRFKDPLNPSQIGEMKIGSVSEGPNFSGTVGTRGYHPGSPTGTDNSTSWDGVSQLPIDGTDNRLGKMLLTKTTGGLPLLLPLQLGGRQPWEIIKRSMPDDSETLKQSRYQTKASVRILIDDENAGNGAANKAGIPAGKGVLLSQFIPSELGGGNALRVVKDDGTYINSTDWEQGDPGLDKKATTVRGVRNDYAGLIAATANTTTGGKIANSTQYNANKTNAALAAFRSSSNAVIPPGSGIKGRILIEVIPPATDANPNPVPVDVTQTVLSMGVTVGEPNAVVHLQRPLWAAFMQGSRDRNDGNEYLTYFLDNSVSNRRAIGDGEIDIRTGTGASLSFDAAGFINSADNKLDDDLHTASEPFKPTTMSRDDVPAVSGCTPSPSCLLNAIVPINVYNVREGRVDEIYQAAGNAYTRGITSVVEINMRNLARWLDGVYDTTLLSGTNARSVNFDDPDGFIVYISDRRGDRVKSERDSASATIQTTNGMVDNEDIYGNAATPQTPNGTLDAGEDVIDDGWDVTNNTSKKNSLQRDTLELPDPVAMPTPSSYVPPTGYTDSMRFTRAVNVGAWATSNQTTAGTAGYFFRRAVRLFNGDNLQITGGTNKLSPTKGLTVASENMVYIWGSYNTSGISAAPAAGVSTLNENGGYQGGQVPASIACDAFFPISKTWFDALPSLYPEGGINRPADAGTAGWNAITPVGKETAVRAGIIAGSTLSSMPASGNPLYYLHKLNGGVHNFPRFLEAWSVTVSGVTVEKRWNYVGSFIILYNSTQAVGPWSVVGSYVYYPPIRNWAFDVTFNDPNKLPPGTPQFQFIQATGFKQKDTP